MKFTLSWLKEHLDTTADVDTLSTTLTALGLEVEQVVDRAKPLAGFRIAHVLEAGQHPNADKLQVCKVDTGSGEPVQVVCGAPNARSGLKVVFAAPGTRIPATQQELKKGNIRGVDSLGMMCSERELCLSDEHAGIIELPADAPVGESYAKWAGLDDPLIEIGLTPDRADCAGVRGIARDLAAAGLGTLKPQTAGHIDITPVPGLFPSPIGVRIEAPEGACPLFIGRTIRHVRNGPSPRWLQERLLAVGLRPISALVDVTNLLSLDAARPLHVFDGGRVTGDIIVRLAKPGEPLAALNGKTYTLDETMTVIADESGALSLAGVMGGETTGCTGETTTVFVECALFDPVRTAAAGRAHAIDSDARYRFERGVDPGAAYDGIELATRLILEMCGGEPSELVVAGAVPPARAPISLRADRVLSLGGLFVPVPEQLRVLQALGFTTQGPDIDGVLEAIPPTWRGDVQGEADLVEEILRVLGFDNIPATPLERTVAVTRPALDAKQRRTVQVRRALADRGLSEAVTWSFLSSAVAERFGAIHPGLRLLNPISSDLDVMRPSLLPNLVQAAGRNADRGWTDVGLFEIGAAFRTPTPEGQDLVAAGVRTGAAVPRHWSEKTRPVDAFDAKADALAVLEASGAPVASLQISTDAPDWYHPGRSGSLRLGNVVMGRFGELHPGLLDALGVKGPVVAFEVFPDTVPAARRKSGTARPLLKLSTFQPIRRDFAFLVDATVEADKIVRAVRSADKALIQDVDLFDLYQGPGVEAGRKSVAVSVVLQPTEKTLTDVEIEAVGAKIVAAVVKATGAALRG